MHKFMKYYDFMIIYLMKQCNIDVFKAMCKLYGILIMKEEFYEIKHVLIKLHDFMMKSSSNQCFF